MSKLVTDKIQKSGGEELTLPSAQATANHQPIVGATDGTLSHSPIALPATVGTDGQVLTSTGSAAAWESQATPPASPIADNQLIVGAVYNHSNRENVYSTGQWENDGPDGNAYHHELDTANSLHMAWNFLLGDGEPQSADSDSSNLTFAHNWVPGRYKQFAHNRRLGYNYRYFYWHDNGTTYPGATWMCIPIRNNGSESIDVVFQCSQSARQNQSGAGRAYYTPTFSSGTNYANATGGAWTVLSSYQSSTDRHDYTATVPVPANTTVLFMCTSTWNYRTTYQFFDTNLLRSLHTTFSNANIVCDLKMLEALYMARSPAAIKLASTPYELYTTCATLFGDR